MVSNLEQKTMWRARNLIVLRFVFLFHESLGCNQYWFRLPQTPDEHDSITSLRAPEAEENEVDQDSSAYRR